jgi:hypothetical protein
MSATRPALLVAIDTEGDNQWDLQARLHQRFDNIHTIGTLHDFFVRHGVRPTYVITHPVAKDPRSAETLRGLLAQGHCEIGAHHHAWETPPCTEADVHRHPYALQLPLDQFDAQLSELTKAIVEAVGEQPVSYRSGRFGFSASHVSSLEQQGYLVDSSVAPLFYEAHKGGPDFVEAPLAPYFLAYDNATRPGTSDVLELPISAALNRRVPAWLAHAYARAPFNYTTKRALRLARVAQINWLRPSYSSAADMCTLGRRLVERGAPILNLLFHSSEALVGGSPYNKTQGELDAFYERLGTFLTFATKDLGAEAMTFREFHASYARSGSGAA